jgi:mannan endo-1,4-beta-mannosidase
VEKLVTRRNTITGLLYRDDPAIFGWELMNEAQVITGRWAERRAWFAEMSAYVKSLDPNHLVAPGAWGYRSASERREWLDDHAIPTIDYCDVHNYPRDDHDSFVNSPAALKEFIENRAAAAYSLRKPLVLGEFGMGVEGHNGASQVEWYKAFFDGTARAGGAGAMFWILTPDARRGYGVTYSTARDKDLLSEISRASQMFAAVQSAEVPARLQERKSHLIPRQFAWARGVGDEATLPQMIVREDKSILYQFKPQMAAAQRFEKIGGGPGYIWGSGSGYLEYVVPTREDRRQVSEIIVRAHIQPVLPIDASAEFVKTRVTLFVQGWNGGSRLIAVPSKGEAIVQEWRLTGRLLRLRAMRGLPLTIRFAVTPDADWPYGVNISNWPEGYDSKDARPVEVELRH